MKNLINHFLVLSLLGFGFALDMHIGQSQAYAVKNPEVTVKKATEETLALLRKDLKKYQKDYPALYEMVYTQLSPYFDFHTMSKLVLGRSWRTANKDQRARFADAFSRLLVRTYSKVIIRYPNEKIVYLPYRAKPTDKKAIVKTKVISSSGGPDLPIHYSFFNKNNDWKVFDVSVEGISLINNYRSVYREKVKKQGLESVIKMIQNDPGQTEADKKKNKK